MTDLPWILLEPLLSPASRTFLPAMLLSVLVAVMLGAGARSLFSSNIWLHPSSKLDVQLLVVRQLLAVLAIVRLGTPLAFATILARALDRAIGVPAVPDVALPALSIGYSLVLFVAWDASRYAVHRAMHFAPLWRFHQVHHSAEVLTPMTFHRVHPVESLVYALRGVVVTGTLAGVAFWLWRGAAVEMTILGVNAVGLLLNGLTGNLRHSHVWLRFGRMERWLLSPAQHQLHHAEDPALQQSNYGTWLSIWDRMAGSLVLAPDAAPARYGLRPEDRNHRPDDLLSALLAPFAGIFPVRAVVVGVASMIASVSRADPPETEPPVEDPAADDDGTVIVESKRGVPNEPGSAHVIGEAELERYRYDDVGKVLTRVPGVYVRTEDGYGLRPNIGMRGASSDRSSKVTVLEDGIPLVPAPYAAPAAYYFPMASRMVGIEVFKGASSIRHGPQTIGGAINLLTRPVPASRQGALDVGIGSYGTLKANGWGALGNEHLGVLIESSNLVSEGFKQLDGGGPTGFERQDLMLKARATGGTDLLHTVELKLGYGRERSNETYLGLNTADFAATPYRRYAASADDEMTWKRGQSELSYKLVGARFDLRAVGYFHRLHRIWRKVNRFEGGPDLHDLLQSPGGGQSAVYLAILRGEEDTTTSDQNLLIGTNDRSFDSGGAQLVLRHRAGTDTVTNALEVGVRLHVDEVYRYQTEDPFAMVGGRLQPTGGDTLVALDAATESIAVSTYVSDDLGVGPVRVSPGVRVEAIRNADGTGDSGPEDPSIAVIALPGIGLLAEVAPGLAAFAGAHRGFSPVAPGSADDTRPETAWSYEAGFRANKADTHAEAIGFLSDYDNVTGQCTLSSGCAPEATDLQFNGGAAWVWGVEAMVSQRVPLGRHRLGGELTYTLTGTRFRSAFVSAFPQFGAVSIGDELPYVPEHQGSAQLFDEHPLGTLAVVARARSAMRDVAGQGKIAAAEVVPATLQLDVSGSFNLSPHLSAWANATNLLGTATVESWRPFGARPAAPLMVMIGVKAH